MPVLVIGNATDTFFESVGKIYVGIPYPSPHPFPYEASYELNDEMKHLLFIDFWISKDNMFVHHETVREFHKLFLGIPIKKPKISRPVSKGATHNVYREYLTEQVMYLKDKKATKKAYKNRPIRKFTYKERKEQCRKSMMRESSYY